MLPSSLIEAADRYRLSPSQVREVLEARSAVSSLVSALAQVGDPRRAEGRRFVLAGLLAVLVLATLAGCRSMRSAWSWARDLEATVLLGLGFARGLPVRSTVVDVVGKIDMACVSEAMLAWIAGRLAAQADPGGRVHVAIDGKALRGARHRGADRAPMQLAVFAPDPGVVLAAAEVPAEQGKGGEIAAAITALDQIPSIAGWVVTGDALHTVKETAAYLRRRGGHYIVPVKANRAILHAEVTDIPWNQVPAAWRTAGRGHGREEERVYQVVEITQPETGSAGRLSLPGARQAVRVTSTRRLRGRLPSVTTLYYVTSLGPEDATGPQIADLIRARWGIENRLHWIRDVVFDEDRHTTRRENTTRLAILLRSVAISLIHLAGLPITDTTTACYRRPEKLYTLVR
ncbi:ISAs1 family transposase [Myceligenerans indicum]|uniref:ISAs1 family transposase n=1 Tax=Myceligenerans indicum TaxID=2593663 RepID=A0ABS1LRP7_9MICO|nr:ISAs1 family transposase [Myceligenerans indicum]MBL0888910.1 ISAs1 family transposase [Myceligenerans indicum]